MDGTGALPLLGRGKYWQEMELGPLGRTYRRTITEADLVNFISVTGMLEAIFIDAHFPHPAIEGRLVPAALTQGLIEGMIFQTAIQGTGLAMLEMTTRALAPVRVNDSIWATITTTDIRPTSQGNRAIIASEVDVYNQHDTKVMTYTVKRMLAGAPQDASRD